MFPLSPNSSSPGVPLPDRRAFLQGVAAAGLAACGLEGLEAARPARGEDGGPEAVPGLLPAVALGKHRVTRLILGGNPVYGHSHFNRLYSQHLTNYHTPGRVVELLRASAAAGINTWQNSHAPRTLEDVERCRAAGVRFHWLLLGKPDWDQRPEVIDQAARLDPIGIAPHGALAERLNRAGKLDLLKDLLKRIRQTGTLVGLSSHDPRLIERAEEEDWDVDYHMCCLYYLTRPRDELTKQIGEVPLGEVYLPSDRERMLQVVRLARKPCLVYKVLAAGRTDLSASGVRSVLEKTLRAIKPTDAMIIGMFQEFGDQVAENARTVRQALGGA